MGQTANLNLPYPENTDPLADMAAAVQALANGVDAVEGGPWTDWTPDLGNFTVGTDGTVIARYQLLGKTVRVRLCIIGGTGASATGILTIGLPPVGAPAGADDRQVLPGNHSDSTNRPAWALVRSSGLYPQSTATGSWVNAFGPGHALRFNGAIELA